MKLRASRLHGQRCASDVLPRDSEVTILVVEFDAVGSSFARRQRARDEDVNASAGWADLGVAVELFDDGLSPLVDEPSLGVSTVVEVNADERRRQLKAAAG